MTNQIMNNNMKRKEYSTPLSEVIELHVGHELLLTSGSGAPQLGTDVIDYDGVGGSFGSDEEVSSRVFDLLGGL